MASKVKVEIKMEEEEDEDMDVEALRLAALQTLKKPVIKREGTAVKSESFTSLPNNFGPGSHNSNNRHPRGRGPRMGRGRGMGMGRGRGRTRSGPHIYPQNNNFQSFHAGNNPAFFPNRPAAYNNLITIVPTVPDNLESPGSVVNSDSLSDTQGIHLARSKTEQSFESSIAINDQEKVPAKFRRLDEDSDSDESEDDNELDTKSHSDCEGSSAEEDNQALVKEEKDSDNESEKDDDIVNLQPEDEGEDSLERLMRELEDEINESSEDKKKIKSTTAQKLEKRSKRERKEKKKRACPSVKSEPEIDLRVNDASPSQELVREPSLESSQVKPSSPRSPSPRLAQALKSESLSPQLRCSRSGHSPGGPWSPRRCNSPRRALSPQGVHALPKGTASNRSPSRSYASSRPRSPNLSPYLRRSRTRSPYRSPRRSPARYPPRLSSPGRSLPLRSRSRSPRRFRSKSRSPVRIGFLRRSRTRSRSRSASRVVRRSLTPARRASPLRRSRSRSPGGRLYPPRRSRSITPRSSFKVRRSFSPKGRRSPSPYSKKLSPRRRSISPRRSPAWSGSYPPRRSRSPPPLAGERLRSRSPYGEPYPTRRASPVPKRYSPVPHRGSPVRGYRSPSPVSRRRSPLPPNGSNRRSPVRHRAASPSFRYSRSLSPGRIRERPPSPGGRPPPSPVRTRDRPLSPARTRDRPVSPARSREKPLSPVRARDRPLSPVRARDRPPSPVRGRERLPSPGKIRDRPLSPKRVRERLPSPGRLRERPLSPIRAREKVSPSGRARDRPLSPGRKRERPLSPLRGRDRLPSPPANSVRLVPRPATYQRSDYQSSRAPSPRKHSPVHQIQKSLSSPRLEKERSPSESISLSPSPEPQPALRLHEDRSRGRKSQPLRDPDSKRSRADLRNVLPKRRSEGIEDGRSAAPPVEEVSKRERREKKKSKKEKKSKKNAPSQNVDPVLEARKRKFESGVPVEVTGKKKIRLRTATSEPLDSEKLDHYDEVFDIEKAKERELKEATEVDESILDKELMGGVDLLWSDEEDESIKDSAPSASENVQFKRTFNLPSGSKAEAKYKSEEPSSTTNSPQAHELSDGDCKESEPEDYQDSCDSYGGQSVAKPHDSVPKTNKELKELILSQAKGKNATLLPLKTMDAEIVKSKAKGSDDLRAELSRRRAERLTKVSSPPDPDTLPRRLLQSALQGVGFKTSLKSGSRKKHKSPCADEIDKQDTEGRWVLLYRRAAEQKAPAINVTIPKVESPTESTSKSGGKIPIHMRLGAGSRGDDECKVKLKRNVTVGRKKQV